MSPRLPIGRRFRERLLNRLLEPGKFHPHLEEEEASRVKLVNVFLLIAVAITIGAIVLFALRGNEGIVGMCALGLAIQVMELSLSWNGRTHAVRHVFAGLFPFYFVLTVRLAGTFHLVALLSIPFITLSMFLFREQETRARYVILYLIGLGAAFYIASFTRPVFPIEDVALVNALGLLITLGLEVFFLHLFLEELRGHRDRLHESEKRFRTLFDQSPFPLVLYDDQGGIIECNDATVYAMGAISRDELIGRMPSSFSPPCQPDGTPSGVKGLEMDRMVEKHGIHRFEWEHLTLDGRTIPVEITLARIDKHGMFGIWRNLAERKAHEAQIRELLNSLRSQNAQLEAAVERRTRELARINEDLRRSNADLESFAYAVSHDLQEPLRMVGGFVQLLAGNYRSKIDQEGRSFIDFAVSGVARMSALIRDLLDYSRLGRAELEITPTDLNDLVGAKLQDLSPRIEEAGAEVRVGPLPADLLCSASLLGMVFHNLIGNAVKFNRSDRPLVAVEAEGREREWAFAVHDNGIGIPEDQRAAVFEVFRRLHGREEFEGTGIGLALCKRVIERHGGRIWAEQRPGGGTVFRFTVARGLGKRDASPRIPEREERAAVRRA